jgi:hypothetical protein
MTESAPRDSAAIANVLSTSLRALAKQSKGHEEKLDCFVARAPRNDGVGVRQLEAFFNAKTRHAFLRTGFERNNSL